LKSLETNMRRVYVVPLFVLLCCLGCSRNPPDAVGSPPPNSSVKVAGIEPASATDAARTFLMPYFSDLETVAFVDQKESINETTGRTSITGRSEGTLPAVWYLIENDYDISCEQDENNRWQVIVLELDGQVVYVAPNEARTYAELRSATRKPRSLRPKPGASPPQ
jgi:hypothetical protein